MRWHVEAEEYDSTIKIIQTLIASDPRMTLHKALVCLLRDSPKANAVVR